MSKPPAHLGILMLDTKFPRIPGDVGNPSSWTFPVRYAIVPGATPAAVVCADPEPLINSFIEAGRGLVAQGCTGIATTCGFLALIRPRLAAELGVPVAASALEQASQIRDTLAPGRTVGILTISAASLTERHLKTAGVPDDCTVDGVENTSFGKSILGNLTDLDAGQARCELVSAAVSLKEKRPATGAILLECTNMVPYAPDIAAATGVPVYSIHTYLNWFYSSLQPPVFPDL